MAKDDYSNGAGKSSAGDKIQVRAGSLDSRPYKSDMYDSLGSLPKNKTASGNMGGGIQGGDKSPYKDQKRNPTANSGTDDYGKGNPFKKTTAKESKPKTIKDLRDKAMDFGKGDYAKG